MPILGTDVEFWFERYVSQSEVATYESRAASLLVSRNSLNLALHFELWYLAGLHGSQTVGNSLGALIEALDVAIRRLNSRERYCIISRSWTSL